MEVETPKLATSTAGKESVVLGLTSPELNTRMDEDATSSAKSATSIQQAQKQVPLAETSRNSAGNVGTTTSGNGNNYTGNNNGSAELSESAAVVVSANNDANSQASAAHNDARQPATSAQHELDTQNEPQNDQDSNPKETPKPVPTPAGYMLSNATLPDSPDDSQMHGDMLTSALYQRMANGSGSAVVATPTPTITTTEPEPVSDSHDIYRAVYSGVPVLEMQVNGVSVMRRNVDSSLNATQVLKVAGVDKSRRTKILEKEILTGPHEKVQGGYGKYQGTWIPFDRAVALCKQYSVYDLLSPLLSYDMNRANDDTPTKEQVLAAKRKRVSSSSNSFYRQSVGSMTSNSNSPALASASPSTNHQNNNLQNSAAQTPTMISFAQPLQVSSNSMPLASSASAALSSLRGGVSPANPSPNNVTDSYYSTAGGNVTPQNQTTAEFDKFAADIDESGGSVKRARLSSSISLSTSGPAAVPPPAPPSDILEDEGIPFTSVPEKPVDEHSPHFEMSRELMTQMFMNTSNDSVDKLLASAQADADKINIDVPIDESGHTALHWASALARLPLIRDLVVHGALCRRGNYNGETPLIKAVLVTNNSEYSTFSQLLDILYPAIPLADNQGRTVLHHIALTSGIRGRSDASRYYLETLLEWIVRRGSKSRTGRFSLARFMKEVVNRKDNNGDSALNIAARVGNKHIAEQLLDVGADPSITNRAGLCPLDFGVQSLGRELRRPNNAFSVSGGSGARELSASPMLADDLANAASVSASLAANVGSAPVNANEPSSQDHKDKRTQVVEKIKQSLDGLEGSFTTEISEKQQLIDGMRIQLREAVRTLSDRREQFQHLKEISHKLAEWQQSSQSLERAVEEEDRKFNSKNSTGATGDVSTDAVSAAAAAAAATASNVASSHASDGGKSASVALSFEGNFDADQPFRIWPGSEELSKIPTAVLRARVVAYQKNQEDLVAAAAELKSRSAELERKFRKVVSLCTGVEESRVDGLLKGLVKAVESDPSDVDIARVSGFLRKVDDGTGSEPEQTAA